MLQSLAVHVLAYEHKFLHAVAIVRVPISHYAGVAQQELLKLLVGHCGVPLSGIAHSHLLACLLEDRAYILLSGEVAYALGADD